MRTQHDKAMFKEELADISKAISTAWDRAKSLGVDYESFSRSVDQIVAGVMEDLVSCTDEMTGGNPFA